MRDKINAMAIPGLSTIEDLAASVWGIEKHKLFIKIRKRPIVEARQVLMTYRNTTMGFSLREAGEYYGKDHATVVHAEKTVKILRKTDHEFNKKYDEFIELVYKTRVNF